MSATADADVHDDELADGVSLDDKLPELDGEGDAEGEPEYDPDCVADAAPLPEPGAEPVSVSDGTEGDGEGESGDGTPEREPLLERDTRLLRVCDGDVDGESDCDVDGEGDGPAVLAQPVPPAPPGTQGQSKYWSTAHHMT